MTNESTPEPEPLTIKSGEEAKAAQAVRPPTTHITLEDGTVIPLAVPIHVAGSDPVSWPMASPTSYGDPESPHVKLSRFVYDLARRIEARNMALDTMVFKDKVTEEEQSFLEELMSMIGEAPLSQEYAMKLVFSSPTRGIGPHKVIHEETGQWTWCGGRGLCRLCTESL